MDARPSDVLVIEHEADCPPGVLADVLAEAGLTLHLHWPYRGDQLPMGLGTFEGLVVLGGGMGARDDAEHPWLPQARRLLALALDRHLPTLGICLGAQLAASALEGRIGHCVAGHPGGRPGPAGGVRPAGDHRLTASALFAAMACW